MTTARIGRRDVASAGRAILTAAADWLSLAAAPGFAAMALWTGVIDVGPLAALCSAEHASPIGGMGMMYLLMSAIHTAPWLRLLVDHRDRLEPAQ